MKKQASLRSLRTKKQSSLRTPRNEGSMTYSASEMMTVAAARALRNSDICFVGIGMPSAACNLARLTHAPDITLIYESGTIVTKLDFVTSFGHGEGGDHRSRMGIATRGPTKLVTDLAVFEPDPASKEMTVTSIHPGVTREQIQSNAGWPVRHAAAAIETPAPTDRELAVLRELHARTARAHGDAAS